MIKNYDPNIENGIHTVEVTLQQWGYIGHLTIKISGNCKGREVLDYDFECEDGENVESDCDFKYDDEYDIFLAILKDEAENTLEVEGDAREFNQMIVKVEIMDFKEMDEQ